MRNKKKIIILIVLILTISVSIVYADFVYDSKYVQYDNSNSSLTSANVQDALDELYAKAENAEHSGNCPDGYDCLQSGKLNKVTYDANGGTFEGGNSENNVYYLIASKEKISKTSNVDDEGNKTTGMPYSSGTTSTVTIEGASHLEVTITYQTYSDGSSSWVTVSDSTITPSTSNYSSSVSGKLYGTTKTTKTYKITGDTVKFFFYNGCSTGTACSNYYGYYAVVTSKSPNFVSNNYSLPSKGNLEFAGWNTEIDGTGTFYKKEELIMNELDTNNKTTTLYALYYDPEAPICKKSTALHTISGTTYGKISNGTLRSGTAFDCDVNKDGIYNPDNERFYYVSSLYTGGSYTGPSSNNETYDSDYAVMIYYNYCGDYTKYGSYSSGPYIAKNNLPTTDEWRDDLLKNNKRNICSSYGGVIKSNFSYEGYAARLLTYQEAVRGAGCSARGSCTFLLENNDAFWYETTYSDSSPGYAYTFSSYNGTASAQVTATTIKVKPVIEVPKSKIDY